MRHYQVAKEQAGLRLDKYLADILPEFTRSFIQKIIKGGSIFIDHKKADKTGYRMREGQDVVVVLPSLKETGIQAENIQLDIVYEDDDILVVNKPAGMVVHPTDWGAHISGTFVNAVMHHCPHLSGIGGGRRPGIVHRLDRDTSGLIVVAKNDAAHRFLARQWEGRTVAKKYIALLAGRLKPRKGSIEAPLLEGKRNERVRVSNRPCAKYALTHYTVKKYLGDYSLTEVRIVTGRTHQIRVHFASIGHPVCGDEVYGNKSVNAEMAEKYGLNRQFLHAASLKFRLPENGRLTRLEAPLPKDLACMLRALSKRF